MGSVQANRAARRCAGTHPLRRHCGMCRNSCCWLFCCWLLSLTRVSKGCDARTSDGEDSAQPGGMHKGAAHTGHRQGDHTVIHRCAGRCGRWVSHTAPCRSHWCAHGWQGFQQVGKGKELSQRFCTILGGIAAAGAPPSHQARPGPTRLTERSSCTATHTSQPQAPCCRAPHTTNYRREESTPAPGRRDQATHAM